MKARHVWNLPLAGCAAVVGLLGCWWLQPICFTIPTQYRGRPQDGTPAAGYCSVIDHWYRWAFFPLIAVAITLGISRALGRGVAARAVALGVVSVLAITNILIAASLRAYDPCC